MQSKYFKQPSNWGKAPAHIAKVFEKQVKWLEQAKFHNLAISRVKRALGNKCTFLAHSTDTKDPSFYAILIVDGKRKRYNISSNKQSFSDIVAEDYKKLKDVLNEYTRSKKPVPKS